MKQRASSSNIKTYPQSSRQQKTKTSSPFKKVAIVIICLAMIAVALAIALPLIFSEENLAKQKLDSLAEDYYENHLYEDLMNSGKVDKDNLEEAMKTYSERGFTHILLRQILLHESYKDSDDAKFLRESCDENRTIIRFFPESPYTQKSYHTEITYSCNF